MRRLLCGLCGLFLAMIVFPSAGGIPDEPAGSGLYHPRAGVFVPTVTERLFTIETNRRGGGKVRLVRDGQGHWRLFVADKPYVVRGVTYAPTRVGESPHNGTLRNWQFIDDDNNGVPDVLEVWIDANRNGKRDRAESVTNDFALLKRMGCNTIRLYHTPPDNVYDSSAQFNKPLLRRLYKEYGIRIIMGDYLGAYTIGSGARWLAGTDYRDPEQCRKMKELLRKYVLDHKDEPYVLLWLLGNENNLAGGHDEVNATRTLAWKYPEAYARFLNECALMIHQLDPDHPVAVGNADLPLVDHYAKHAGELDILGINAYRGAAGFGKLWSEAQGLFDRPLLITEYGCDGWDSVNERPDEAGQAAYHQGCWEDIVRNLAGSGTGNALGGVVFEYLDEWWKNPRGNPALHDATTDCRLPFPDGWSSEEWLGLVSQGDGKNSPRLRQLRKAFFYYEKAWNLGE